jgi:hypothetical protein
MIKEGIFRGKVDGKLKKVNVYHIFLGFTSGNSDSCSSFDETIAICKGTIIGKLFSKKD